MGQKNRVRGSEKTRDPFWCYYSPYMVLDGQTLHDEFLDFLDWPNDQRTISLWRGSWRTIHSSTLFITPNPSQVAQHYQISTTKWKNLINLKNEILKKIPLPPFNKRTLRTFWEPRNSTDGPSSDVERGVRTVRSGSSGSSAGTVASPVSKAVALPGIFDRSSSGKSLGAVFLVLKYLNQVILCDLFIPDRWRSRITFEKGHVFTIPKRSLWITWKKYVSWLGSFCFPPLDAV